MVVDSYVNLKLDAGDVRNQW